MREAGEMPMRADNLSAACRICFVLNGFQHKDKRLSG